MQLFNAVRQPQKVVESKLKDAGSSETRREKVMKSMTKGAFIDLLKGTKPTTLQKKSEVRQVGAYVILYHS